MTIPQVDLHYAGNNELITLRCGLRRLSLNRVSFTSAQFVDLSLVAKHGGVVSGVSFLGFP